jgi:hypothetical protein
MSNTHIAVQNSLSQNSIIPQMKIEAVEHALLAYFLKPLFCNRPTGNWPYLLEKKCVDVQTDFGFVLSVADRTLKCPDREQEFFLQRRAHRITLVIRKFQRDVDPKFTGKSKTCFPYIS